MATPRVWVFPALALLALLGSCLFDKSRRWPDGSGVDADEDDLGQDAQPADARFLDAPRSVLSPLSWLTIPAGSFTMGSPADEPCREPHLPGSETPRRVTLTRSFAMLAIEVTRGQFELLLGYLPIDFLCGAADCPMTRVTWHEAVAFANALSTRERRRTCYRQVGSGMGCPNHFCPIGEACAGRVCLRYQTDPAFARSGSSIHDCPGYRLPTEAEWEHAYRAGTRTAHYRWPMHDRECGSCKQARPLAGLAWYHCTGVYPHPVGLRPANPWGLHDMDGNVAEWCSDRFVLLRGDSAIDPIADWGATDPVREDTRAVRGGAFDRMAGELRAAFRQGMLSDSLRIDVGFRLVRTLP